MSKDCTIQDVFHRFYSSFESTHSISPAQRKAAYHIMNCKTGAFGVNVSVCEDCGCVSVHYNSCRDRCCPMCQEFPKEKWVDARREDILDAPYFHVVFTVPEELNPIIYSNQKFLYTALYHAASDTLSELAADSKYLGTDIGYICILHTWGSTMNFHPHIHAIVLGGGLDVKNHWKDNGKEFFLPIKVISKIFRGKYMAELKQLWENDRLEFHGSAAPYKNYYTFKELLNTCYTLVDVLFAYLKKMEPTVPTSGQLRKAYTYILNQEKYLRVFLEDGEVPIDNNASERAIRGFCIGKKNWQMIDTINGAHSSAIIYSIAETAKANNLKPYDYFVYLLEEIPKHMEQKDRTFLEDLLPWSKKLPEGIRKQQ